MNRRYRIDRAEAEAPYNAIADPILGMFAWVQKSS